MAHMTISCSSGRVRMISEMVDLEVTYDATVSKLYGSIAALKAAIRLLVYTPRESFFGIDTIRLEIDLADSIGRFLASDIRVEVVNVFQPVEFLVDNNSPIVEKNLEFLLPPAVLVDKGTFPIPHVSFSLNAIYLGVTIRIVCMAIIQTTSSGPRVMS